MQRENYYCLARGLGTAVLPDHVCGAHPDQDGRELEAEAAGEEGEGRRRGDAHLPLGPKATAQVEC